MNDMKKETDILKKLNHHNIIKYKESLEDDFKTYIVLEYIEGGTLDLLIQNQNEAFPKERIQKILLQFGMGDWVSLAPASGA